MSHRFDPAARLALVHPATPGVVIPGVDYRLMFGTRHALLTISIIRQGDLESGASAKTFIEIAGAIFPWSTWSGVLKGRTIRPMLNTSCREKIPLRHNGCIHSSAPILFAPVVYLSFFVLPSGRSDV